MPSKTYKKVIAKFDGGVQTDSRDSNPQTSLGSQMIKHFDIYTNPYRLLPMPSWQSFTTNLEKVYNIRALGGLSSTIYGVGKGLSNWYGSGWSHRVKVTPSADKYIQGSIPLRIDLASMPADFWNHVKADGSDIRVANSEHAGTTYELENFDLTNKKGDLWISSSSLGAYPRTENVVSYFNEAGTGNYVQMVGASGASGYAYSFKLPMGGQKVNRISFRAYKTGSPGDLRVELYTDNAGKPGTFIATLGTISTIGTTEATHNINFADLTLPHADTYVVFSGTGFTGSNYYSITLSTAGTYTTLYHTTAYTAGGTNTSWSTLDATSTPWVQLSYVTDLTPEPDYVYVYYGNPNAGSIPNGIPGYPYPNQPMDTWEGTNMRFAYTFPGNTINKYDGDTVMVTEPAYLAGLFGKAIDTLGSYITTDSDDEVALTGSDITVSFMIKLIATPTGNTYVLQDGNNTWDIYIDINRKVNFFARGVSGTATYTSTTALTVGQWYTVDCIYDSNYYIAINGVVETFADNNGNYSYNPTNNTLLVDTGGVCYLAQVWGFNNDLSANQVLTKYNNLISNSTFWSIGAQESLAATSLQYGGVQVYTKSLASGNWQEYLEVNQPVKDLNYHPVNGFVEVSGGTLYFIVSTAENDEGILFLAMVDAMSGLKPDHLYLGLLQEGAKLRPLSESPVDKKVYFNFGSSYLGTAASPGSASNFAAYSTVTSLVPWRNYLAVGSTRRTRANIEIWDLVSSSPLEFVDAGLGNLRVVGNASDVLFAVVDNYIDDAVLSSNKPEMVVRQYVGNGRAEDVVRMEIPSTYTAWTDNWERAVSTFRFRRDNQTLFYASLPANATATEFNSGLWAVGKGSDGNLALSLMIDTSEFGPPENVYGFAKQAFFVEKDGGIQRLASDGTYDKVSLYRTRWMNEGNNEIEKDLKGIEIACEPLEAGQTISVYYKANGDSDRTLIAEFTGTGEIAFESVNLPSGGNLPTYREIHFDIESTGGKSAIREFNYKYQYLSDLV